MNLIEALQFFQEHGKRIAHDAYAGHTPSIDVMDAYRHHFHNPHSLPEKAVFVAAILLYQQGEAQAHE